MIGAVSTMHLYRAPGLEPGCFHARWQKQRKMGWIFLQLRFTGLHTDGVEPHFQPSRKAVCCKGGNTNTKKEPAICKKSLQITGSASGVWHLTDDRLCLSVFNIHEAGRFTFRAKHRKIMRCRILAE
jgi:hypothetical protein